MEFETCFIDIEKYDELIFHY